MERKLCDEATRLRKYREKKGEGKEHKEKETKEID